MGSKILLCVAIKDELPRTDIPRGIDVLYSGVGKINTAISITNAINIYKPKLIVNFGTAGSIGQNIAKLCIVKDVIERDMITAPLAERGVTPFDSTPHILSSISGQYRCATGDSFMTQTDQWLLDSSVDLIDMELFAIAKACHRFEIPWRAAKFVTDTADENAGSDWQQNLLEARGAFMARAEELLTLP